MLGSRSAFSLIINQVRYKARPNRSAHPTFARLRAKKYIKVDLPDYEALRNKDNMEPGEIRAKLKQQGYPMTPQWRENPMTLSSTSEVMEKYEPPAEDRLSTVGERMEYMKGVAWKLKDKLPLVGKDKKAKNMIRKVDSSYTDKKFALEAETIYKNAHIALMNRDEDRLHELVSELAFPLMWNENSRTTVVWEWLELLEPSSVVQIRAGAMFEKANVFAQITVRMHSRQKLAIYDQFGSLLYGNPSIAQDVLEYIVFEQHLADYIEGRWRIHCKIPVPTAAATTADQSSALKPAATEQPRASAPLRTHRVPYEASGEPSDDQDNEEAMIQVEDEPADEEKKDVPRLAAA